MTTIYHVGFLVLTALMVVMASGGGALRRGLDKMSASAIVILGVQSPVTAAVPAPMTASTQGLATIIFWLAVVMASVAFVLLIFVLGAWIVGMIRSRRLPSRQAQEALSAARAEIRRVFQTQREIEARLLHSMAGAGFGAWSVDLVTGRSWRSQQYDRIFGYSSPLPQWTLRMFLDHVLEEDREAVEKTLLDAHQSADGSAMSVAFECRIHGVRPGARHHRTEAR